MRDTCTIHERLIHIWQ